MQVELTVAEMQLIMTAMQLATGNLDQKFGQAVKAAQDAALKTDSPHGEENLTP